MQGLLLQRRRIFLEQPAYVMTPLRQLYLDLLRVYEMCVKTKPAVKRSHFHLRYERELYELAADIIHRRYRPTRDRPASTSASKPTSTRRSRRPAAPSSRSPGWRCRRRRRLSPAPAARRPAPGCPTRSPTCCSASAFRRWSASITRSRSTRRTASSCTTRPASPPSASFTAISAPRRSTAPRYACPKTACSACTRSSRRSGSSRRG